MSVAGGVPVLASHRASASKAQGGEETTSESNSKVVRETDEYYVTKHTRNGEESYYQVTKESGAVAEIPNKDGGIGTMGHDEIFGRSNLSVDRFASCGGYIYSHHYFISLSVELGTTWDEVTGGSLEAATCAVAGARGGLAGAAVGAVGCFIIGRLFLDHLNPSDSTGTWGGWDCHRGIGNYANVCHGVTERYAASRSQVPSLKRIPGTHIEIMG